MRILTFASCVLCIGTWSAWGSGCSKPSEPAAAAPQPNTVDTTHAAQQPEAAPKPAAAASADTVTAGGLHFRAPKPFVSRQPKSSMRAAEYGLATDATSELAVFYFGPDQGGSVDANVTRWVGQFKKPDGSDAEAKRSERMVHDIPVAIVETLGTYNGGMGMPGAAAPSAIQDAMLLGAIAKGPQGAVFFKFVGPRANVEGARSAFDALLESLAP
jgi:hypothetical protein